MISNLLVALAVTLAVELVAAALWGVRNRMGLLLVALANVLTNPAVNLLFALAILAGWPATPVTLALEVLAVLVEWRVYRSFQLVENPLWFAVVANVCSFTLGQLIGLLV